MPPQVARDIKSFQSIKPQSSSTTVNGTAIDTAGYDEAVIVLDCGTTTATGTLDVKVQESVDAAFSSPIDIAGAAFAQVTPTNDDAIYVGTIRLEGARKQFIRVVGVAATAASIYGASVHLAQGESKPAQTPSFAV
jgi:hypothetical protein